MRFFRNKNNAVYMYNGRNTICDRDVPDVFIHKNQNVTIYGVDVSI